MKGGIKLNIMGTGEANKDVTQTDASLEKTVENDPQNKKKSFKGSPVLQELLYLLIKIVAISIALTLVLTFMFGVFRCPDSSMSPAIKDGDLVIYDRLDKDYIASETLALNVDGQMQVRRVVATQGDVVDINEKGFYINGALQHELNIYEETQRFDTDVEFPLTVGSGEVFVLGDSRTIASDSRVYGAVKAKDTLGKVVTIIRRRGI